MKHVLFTLLMISGLTSFSQTGNLIFFTEEGEPFTVSVNGIKNNETPMANVKIENVKAPGCMVTIVFSDVSLGVIKKNVMVGEGREYTYKVKRSKKGEWKVWPFTDTPIDGGTVVSNPTPVNDEVIQQKTADPIVESDPIINDNVQSESTTVVTTTNSANTNVNPGGSGISLNINLNGAQGNQKTVSSTTTTTTTTTTNGTTNTVNSQTNSNPTGIGLSFNVNVNDATSTNTVNTDVSTTSTSTDVNTTDNSKIETTTPTSDFVETSTTTDNSGCSMAMEDDDFRSAKSSIASKSFEDSKMKVAKQITEVNCLSTTQVKEIMGLFSFEASKLDYAKFAYQYTYDKNKYYKINDAFGFESSIDDLQSYIKANK